jgi:DNA-binding winged helix-turn-helix (wHTH) protein/predicted ATPase
MPDASRGEEICFGGYRLHATQGLWCDGSEVHVTPKSLALLRLLAERTGQVVTKEEILGAVWPKVVVSDAALVSCIQELRRALADDARRPRFIETVHRRGYRFIAATKESTQARTISAQASTAARRIVGRDRQLQALTESVSRALDGERQLVFVTGEPGIGKTALVETFVARIARSNAHRVARADCTDRYGAGEAYQPLLEALTRLCRQPASESLLSALRRFAPTWLAQLPALQTEAELATLLRQTAGATPTRMLRELNDALEEMSRLTPIVLWLEDLHWCDMSTLDWIAAFARRHERAHIVLIATYRADESTAAARQLNLLTHDLTVRGLCRCVALDGLDEGAARDYISNRFPTSQIRTFEQLAALVHRRTEGHPLFLGCALNDLVTRGVITEVAGQWSTRADIEIEASRIPEDVRRLLEHAAERLAPQQRSILEVASLLGRECTAAAIAAGVELAAAPVEAVLHDLARRHSFVREVAGVRWPDGTVTARFEFLHALHREVLRDSLSPAHRAELHSRVGRRLESAYGERVAEIAAELAVHFDEAGDSRRAIAYLKRAAEIDRRRAANRAAEVHLTRALVVLDRLPASTERDELELTLSIDLGSALMATRGFGATEVEACYARAHTLCQRRKGAPQQFPVLWGLWLFYLGKGDTAPTRELSDAISTLASTTDDHATRLQAHHAEWATALSEGNLSATEAHARAGMAVYDVEQHASMASTYGDHDPGVCALSFMARAAVLAGRPNAAIKSSDEAIALARDLSHPFSLALALVFGAFTHQARRDVENTRHRAAEAGLVAREHGFGLMLAWATALEGWSLVRLGEREAGLAALRAGVEAAHATDSFLFAPLLLSLLAEAQLECEFSDAARATLDEAFRLAERNRDGLATAELHRLMGELSSAHGPASRKVAEREFRCAFEIADRQGAKLVALRAAVRLSRLWILEKRADDAANLLTAARAAVSDGDGAEDVRDAEALISDCERLASK